MQRRGLLEMATRTRWGQSRGTWKRGSGRQKRTTGCTWSGNSSKKHEKSGVAWRPSLVSGSLDSHHQLVHCSGETDPGTAPTHAQPLPVRIMVPSFTCFFFFTSAVLCAVSDREVINTGEPQGTVLSPLLFTIHTTDFNYHSESFHLQKSSDDSAKVD